MLSLTGLAATQPALGHSLEKPRAEAAPHNSSVRPLGMVVSLLDPGFGKKRKGLVFRAIEHRNRVQISFQTTPHTYLHLPNIPGVLGPASLSWICSIPHSIRDMLSISCNKSQVQAILLFLRGIWVSAVTEIPACISLQGMYSPWSHSVKFRLLLGHSTLRKGSQIQAGSVSQGV